MQYHSIQGEVNADGVLEIRLPPDLVGHKITGVIVFEDRAPAAPGYDFSRFAGTINLETKPVQYQRKVRDEW